MDNSKSDAGKFLFGVHAGTGWAYADEAHLFNTVVSVTVDYHIAKNFYLQFAPGYIWAWKWNEHYLTLPIHIRKRFGECISLFAGPALIFDIGHFKDLGVSAGIYFHYTTRSSLVLSASAFTLYDYNIDFLYLPVNISYRFSF